MNHHSHPKKEKMGINLLGALLLVLLSIVVIEHFSKPVLPTKPDTVVATTTPKTPKPAGELSLTISPHSVQQGEPALITVDGLESTAQVKSFTFNNRPLVTFLYNGQVTALLGVDFNSATGTFPLVLTLADGKQVHDEFVIAGRYKPSAPFGIPDKLGGNTPESVKTLISTLIDEAKIMNSLPTAGTKLWTEKFGSPLDGPLVVADPYGYTRVTGNSTLTHKGTDLKASIGTPVYAMNRGIARFTGYLRNYGNTVVLDHGLGLETVYMHLSKVNVSDNQMVEKGQLIGLSGDTGYVLGPHLHLTVRVWDVSIDPMKFLELLGDKN